ncbi:hypothetical protein [Achromobacter aloeverae]
MKHPISMKRAVACLASCLAGLTAAGCAQDAGVQVSPEALDFSYQVTGAARDSVQRVMSDGTQTILVLNGRLPGQQVRVVADGALQTGQVRGDAVVIAGVPKQLQVKLPSGIVRVQHVDTVVEPASPKEKVQDIAGNPDTNLDWDKDEDGQAARSPTVYWGAPKQDSLGQQQPTLRPGPLPTQPDDETE